jgi:HD superfamily phosphohydrolase
MSASARLADPVYGVHTVQEPVLQELLGSSALTRLRGVHQAGAGFLVRAGRDVSRYQHSVGVMLLIRQLGGSLEEQAAGLVHDVSHTAFSHLVDHVFDRRAEDYHEQHFARLVRESDIPRILSEHNLDTEAILDIDRWTLLEQPAPMLSADRIDYTLRDLTSLSRIETEEARKFVRNLTVVEGRIAARSLACGQWFARQYAVEVNDLFMDPRELYANARLGDAIRTALDAGVLEEKDLFGEDASIIARLRDAELPITRQVLAELNQTLRVVEDPVRPTVHAHAKARLIDPLVLDGANHAVPCSLLDSSIGAAHRQIRARAERGWLLRNAADENAS